MEKLFFRIGNFAVWHMWVDETVGEVLVESLFIYVMLQVVCAAGLFGIFTKLNSSRRLAWIPGVNMARLGDVCGCRAAGFAAGLCKIGFLIVVEASVRVYLIPLLDEDVLTLHCGIIMCLAAGLLLVRTAAGFVMYRKLIRRFSESRWWMIMFLLFPNITMLFFGFNPNILA